MFCREASPFKPMCHSVKTMVPIAKSWKALSCSSVIDWISELYHINAVENYPGTERTELWMQATPWVHLIGTMLREDGPISRSYILENSLVAQWLKICLPVQGTRVQALVQEDPTYCGATKPVCHNY